MAMATQIRCFAQKEDKLPIVRIELEVGDVVRFASRNNIPQDLTSAPTFLDFLRQTDYDELTQWYEQGEIAPYYYDVDRFNDFLQLRAPFERMDIFCYEWESGLG